MFTVYLCLHQYTRVYTFIRIYVFLAKIYLFLLLFTYV